MRVCITGTRGIPNNYGGFETLVEYLAQNLSKEIEIVVICSSRDLDKKYKYYNGAKLIYIPISSHGAMGVIYDSISLLFSIPFYDKVLFLGFGGGFIVPLLKKWKNKLIVNIGGLDWKRSKWSPKAQKLIKKAEINLIKYGNQIISDNIGIQEYIKKEYNKESILIEYGGDQVSHQPITEEYCYQYPFLKSPYAFIVTRIQSDNNIEIILNAFVNQNKIPLVMVGNWNSSSYGKKVKEKYTGYSNIHLVDAIYERNKLDVLRSNCKVYIHGHSAGGTNPSLVEAMYLGLPIIAFASGYNEHTTKNMAVYFKNEKELVTIIESLDNLNLRKMSQELKEIAISNYRWEIISKKYKEVFLKKG